MRLCWAGNCRPLFAWGGSMTHPTSTAAAVVSRCGNLSIATHSFPKTRPPRCCMQHAHQQGRGDALLHGEHDALLGQHADCGGAQLLCKRRSRQVADAQTHHTRRGSERQQAAHRRREERARRSSRITAAAVCCAAHLDRLDSILDLEQPPLWTESVDASIILAARQEHGCC